ncbi:tyrosine-type recombinase/integrase [Halapricum desulfuricans]|uniref:XerD/XerC family integrase n=1 Tax=Halapricum desulfuricans TaxID=2841257 RepID=A0A897N8S8_9EURY|nr:site-specific integrase [Halapricum desulfuricans]QSG07553.1 XerD/XerC family integrase [Halapricum desulfuricans]
MSGNPTKGCDNILEANLDPGRHIKIVPSANREQLSEKQIVDYHSYRESFLKWLLHMGKNPKKAIGYSPYTVYESGYRSAAFDRWVWEQEGNYRLPPDTDDADEYMQEVAYSDNAQSTKGKIEEMLKRYFRWLAQKYGSSEWEPTFSFESGGTSKPRDFLTTEERRQIRESALNHGSIPSYNNLSAEERNQWKSYVSKVLDKPIDDVTPDDWDSIDGWKITSIVWASLDAGLRPVEVGRAKTTWVDTTNEVLRIPHEESSKNRENWIVSITERTASALERWLQEREQYGRYDETDTLWLTTHGNPYGSQSLGRLLKRLCEDSGIRTENRQLSWYAIRHSVGTYMTAERDLAATKAQLRHKSVKTTMKYDQVPVEDRRDALDKMG